MDLNSSEDDEDEPLPETGVARSSRTGTTRNGSDLVALPTRRDYSWGGQQAGPLQWRVGDRCRARYGARLHGPACTMWFTGVISAAHDDGACDVAFDDGDFEARVPAACIKPAACTRPAMRAAVEPITAVRIVKEEPADTADALARAVPTPAVPVSPAVRWSHVPVPSPSRVLPARERKAAVAYEAGPAPPPSVAHALANGRANQKAALEGQLSPTNAQSIGGVPKSAKREAEAAAEHGDRGCGGGGGGLKKRPRGRSPLGKAWNDATGEWEDAAQARADPGADEHAEEGGGRLPLSGGTEGGRSRTPPERLLPTSDPRTVPLWRKKELAKEAQAAKAAKEAQQAQPAQPAGSLGHASSQQPQAEGLPPGWKRRTDFGKFKGYVGPQGRKVQTVPLAWAAYAEMHAEVQAEAQAGAQPTEGGAEGGAPLMAGARVMACYGGGAAWYAGAVAAVRALG